MSKMKNASKGRVMSMKPPANPLTRKGVSGPSGNARVGKPDPIIDR